MRKLTDRVRTWVSLVILLIFSDSCYRAQDCSPVTRDFINVQFVDSLGVPILKTLTITSVSADTSLVENSVTQSLFSLALDPFSDTITYVFSDLLTENWLKVGYRNAVFINSEDCGPEFLFSELAIWGSSYDSLRLIDKRMLEGIEVNIRIYDY